MNRKITEFHNDDEGDCYALLDCFHTRHFRHNPPFDDRPWTLTEDGRAAMVGEETNCVRCDRGELPDGVEEYKRTPEFTEETVPKGLLRDHTTRAGTWGMIHVLEGSLEYTISEGDKRSVTLGVGQSAAVVPEQKHHVRPLGAVRFYVAFLTRPAAATA
jgi:tellurite resistance-related uncharacterized protein